MRQLGTATELFVLLLVIKYAFNYFINYFGHVTGAKIEHNMRHELFGHIQRQSLSFFDSQKAGQLMSLISSDLNEITEPSQHGPEDVIISLVRIIGSFVILTLISPMLALTLFAALPVILLVTHRSNMRMSKSRTTFVIAHRLPTIKSARRISVLTENGIVEDGPHQRLMA